MLHAAMVADVVAGPHGFHGHSLKVSPMLLFLFVDQPHVSSKATVPPQAASSLAAHSTSSKDPPSGFTDVLMPRESDSGASAAASNGVGAEGNQGAVPSNARQDAAEPEATLPGGTATEGAHAEPGRSHGGEVRVGAKQRRLDWSAAVGKKRKAHGGVQAPMSRVGDPSQQPGPLPKRQCKLKLSSK